MHKARYAPALAILAVLAFVPAGQAKPASAVRVAKMRLRGYQLSHGWVRSASLRRCLRKKGRLICGARIEGRKKGASLVCAAKVIVVSRGHRRQAELRFGKCSRGSPGGPGASSGKTRLLAHLDPSYTRNPLDPFEVTYAFSASATRESRKAGGSAEEAAPLPSGVLALYSDGKLECAINVGGAVTGGECPVHYSALGEHRVTTIYTSGERSATVTEVENIEPLATETTLEISYANLPGGAEALETGYRCRFSGHECGFSCHFVDSGGPGQESCFFEQEWLLGKLTVRAGSSPAGRVSLSCTGTCVTGDSTSLDGEMTVDVSMFSEGSGYRSPVGAQVPPTCSWMHEHADYWQADADHVHLTATPVAAGYAQDSVTKTLSFTPALPC